MGRKGLGDVLRRLDWHVVWRMAMLAGMLGGAGMFLPMFLCFCAPSKTGMPGHLVLWSARSGDSGGRWAGHAGDAVAACVLVRLLLLVGHIGAR
jgi:hypothetical protein